MTDASKTMETQEVERAIAEYWHKAVKFGKLVADPPEFERGVTPYEVVFQKDRMRLLHYSSRAGKKRGPPVLMVYAVINRPYILDLLSDRSVIRNFLAKGFDVYLIDWGKPLHSDRYVRTEDYVERYIDHAVEWVREACGTDQISLFGYCLGGTLATIYAAVHPEKLRTLMIMAAPVDFEEEKGLLYWWTREEYFDARKMTEAFGNIPDYLFTWTFKYLDPVQNMHLKYLSLFENVQDEEFIDMFFRMEQWIHDGIPVTGAYYRELIEDCYQKNLIVKNEFRVNGTKVNLKDINMPVITIAGEKDHIAHPESTAALLNYISSKDKKAIRCRCGHIGLSVGGRAHREVWPEVTNWLAERSGKV